MYRIIANRDCVANLGLHCLSWGGGLRYVQNYCKQGLRSQSWSALFVMSGYGSKW